MKQLITPFLLLLALFFVGCEATDKQYTNDIIRGPEDMPIAYLMSGLDQSPVIKRGRVPAQPDSQRWERGYAKVQFTVNEKGRTENIKVLENSGGAFGGNTAYAVRFWRFEPALLNGVPTPCDAIVEVYFRGTHFGGVNR